MEGVVVFRDTMEFVSHLPPFRFKTNIHTRQTNVNRPKVAFALTGLFINSRSGRNRVLRIGLPTETLVLFSRDNQSSLATLNLRREIVTCAGIEREILSVRVLRRWSFTMC
jgi:hypothetical protein